MTFKRLSAHSLLNALEPYHYTPVKPVSQLGDKEFCQCLYSDSNAVISTLFDASTLQKNQI